MRNSIRLFSLSFFVIVFSVGILFFFLPQIANATRWCALDSQPVPGTWTVVLYSCTTPSQGCSGELAIGGSQISANQVSDYCPGAGFCCAISPCQSLSTQAYCTYSGVCGGGFASTSQYDCGTGGVCCVPAPNCTTGDVCPGWGGCFGEAANSCNNSGSQNRTCQHTQNQSCAITDFPESQSCGYNNCSANYAPNGPAGNGCTCITTIHVHAFIDYNHDGVQDSGEPNFAGVTMDDNGYIRTTDANGNATDANGALHSGVQAFIQMTTPADGRVWQSNPEVKNLTLNNNNGGSTINYPFVPVYTISGTVYNDINKNGSIDAGEALSGWQVKATGNGSSVTTNTNGSGQFTFTNLVSGSYTVTLSSLPNGYSYISGSISSWTITLGNPSGPANYTCSTNGLPGLTCGGQNNGSIDGIVFAVTNENPVTQSTCGDARFDGGYSQLIPSTASCNGTSGPYAIIQNPALCPTDPGILFSGSTNPTYGAGLGASTSNIVVGDTLFPELFNNRIPNAGASSYSFVMTTLNNATAPPTALTKICPDLTNCVLSETTPGGTYFTAAADGPVSISVSNSDGSFQLGNTNYTFAIGGDLTFTSNVVQQAQSTIAFTSGGNIHVAGNIGESDWTSMNPDLEGFYSADNNFYIDPQYPSGQQCLANGQPKELKLNTKGSIIVNAAGGSGSFINSRDGCIQDLSCPTVTFQPYPLSILNASGALKPPYSFWQELNP